MTVPEEIGSTSKRLLGKKILLAIIIILIVGLAVALWFIFISGSSNTIKNNNDSLPSNCYSVNGKEICVTPKS